MVYLYPFYNNLTKYIIGILYKKVTYNLKYLNKEIKGELLFSLFIKIENNSYYYYYSNN